jgi:hypothetical protein
MLAWHAQETVQSEWVSEPLPDPDRLYSSSGTISGERP